MKALSYFGKNDVRIVEKPRPRLEQPEDAIVRVTTAAICGSDLHLYHGLVPDTRIGHTFGHEFVGIIEEIGDQVKNLKPGDRVVVPFNIACGRCYYCRKRLWSLCENSNPYNELGGIYGYSHTTGGYDGGQAEYVRVPFADVGPRVLPDEISDEQGVLLADIAPTAYFGVDLANVKPGDTVVVFGAGPVGLLAQKIARDVYHAGRVIAVDHVSYRLKVAADICGAEPVNFRDVPNIVGHLRELAGGRGPDACIDAVGLEADGSPVQDFLGSLLLEAGSVTALSWALNTVRPGGTVSIIGVYGPPFNHFVPVGWAMNRGLTVRMGQCNVLNYLDQLIDLTRRGEFDPTFVISHVLPLDQAPRGYEIFERKLDGAIKVLLRPAA
jgi:threonine dehydrogenase-like Zn-dependent dehydrogenase